MASKGGKNGKRDEPGAEDEVARMPRKVAVSSTRCSACPARSQSSLVLPWVVSTASCGVSSNHS